MLLEWLEAPLRDVEAILARQRAVAEFVEQPFLREEIREVLSGIRDLERATAKVSTGRANARDVVGIAASLARVKPLQEKLSGAYWRDSRSSDALDPLDGLVVSAPERRWSKPLRRARREAGSSARVPSSTSCASIAGDGKSWMANAGRESASIITGLARSAPTPWFATSSRFRRGQARVPETYIRRQTVKNRGAIRTPEPGGQFEGKVLGARRSARGAEHGSSSARARAPPPRSRASPPRPRAPSRRSTCSPDSRRRRPRTATSRPRSTTATRSGSSTAAIRRSSARWVASPSCRTTRA